MMYSAYKLNKQGDNIQPLASHNLSAGRGFEILQELPKRDTET